MTRYSSAKLRTRVLGYVRVSTLGQVEDGVSLQRQRDQIEAYCKAKGLGPLEFISDEGVSGYKGNRKGFQRLVELCEKKQVSTVVVYDLSRLSRSVRDTLTFVEDVIQKNGVSFVSLLNDIDTSTPMGKAFLTFNAMFNQLYRDEISHKTKLAMKHKRQSLEKTGGVVPFGFKLVGDQRLQAKPKEFETLLEIHRLRKSGLTLRQIVSHLETRGIRTKTGLKKWHPSVVSQILNRQIDLIVNDPSISDEDKDLLLEDTAGALYQTKAVMSSERAKERLKCAK